MSAPPQDANTGCVGPQSEQAGKASNCAGCPNQSACATGANKGPDPAAVDVAESLSETRHKILILSGKGGVGKSTVTSQFAWSLADRGKRVGVLDIDICGPSMPRMLGVENRDVHRSALGWEPVFASDNLGCMSVGFMLNSRDDAVIWRGPRKNGLIKQFLTDVRWQQQDFLLIDAPPGTSDEHISIVKLLSLSKPDGAIIVTTPQEVALLDVRKEISFCRKVGLKIIGVVENMASFCCPNCAYSTQIFKPTSGGAQKMCAELNVPYLGAIPLDPELLFCCDEGTSFTKKFPESPAAKAFAAVFERLPADIVATINEKSEDMSDSDDE